MNRRSFLGALLAGTTGVLAGCRAPTGSGTPQSREPTGTPTPVRQRLGDVELPVPSSEMDHRLPKDTIPAIVDPVFADDWTGLTVPEHSTYDGGPLLPDDAPVVGVERGGEARAYPLRILDWHEVVNDTFAGPLLVTYCPLCGSSVTAERRVDGAETRFGVSGRLWRNDLVLYDRATDSLWSQLLAAAIQGPRTGERLTQVPATLTSWGEWRATHAGTSVLLPPPHSNTVRGRDETYDYFSSKYLHDDDQLIGRPSDMSDPVGPRQFVVGVTADGVARAYPFDVVTAASVVNDTVGDQPVVVTVTPGQSLVAYERTVDGTVLSFEPAGDAHLRAGGSRWERTTGRAVDGPFEGQRLVAANDDEPMLWTGWEAFHPGTTVYEGG
jgi:hypothetical protein